MERGNSCCNDKGSDCYVHFSTLSSKVPGNLLPTCATPWFWQWCVRAGGRKATRPPPAIVNLRSIVNWLSACTQGSLPRQTCRTSFSHVCRQSKNKCQQPACALPKSPKIEDIQKNIIKQCISQKFTKIIYFKINISMLINYNYISHKSIEYL